MATRIISQSPRVSFRDEGKTTEREKDKGRLSTQESEEEISKSKGRRGMKSGTQGEFSGMYDRSGHHLKSDGTPDMRFKENREEFEGEGFEYTTTPMKKSAERKEMEKPSEREREKEKPSEREREKRKEKSKTRISPEKKMRRKTKSRSKSKPMRKDISEHYKSDGTPDMRFKGNRDEFSGEGYEGTTSRSSAYRMSKANIGIHEGNVPGEHSGKYDVEGHHLKNDNTPDMRFKENREEYSGQGFEVQPSGKPTPRYLLEEDVSEKNVIYRRRRPPTPYALYIKERAPEMKRENEDMDMNEVFRELGKEWRGYSDKQKKKYYDLYEEEVSRYEEQNAMMHKGPLSFRKMAQQRGFKIDFPYSSKRGKYPGAKRFEMETNVDEDEEEEEESYNPEEEENRNPNEGVSA